MKYKITGLDFGVPNRNNRIYLRQHVVDAFDQITEPIFVQLGTVGSNAQIDLAKVCGKVVDVEFTDTEVVADVEILPTPTGQMVSKLLAENSPIELVSCGLGKLSENHVVEDFRLICLAFVIPVENMQYET